MHQKNRRLKIPPLKRKSVLVIVIFVILLVGYVLSQNIFGNRHINDLQNKLDTMALLSEQPAANKICSESDRPNESNFNYSRYALWYEKVQDSEDVIKQLTSRASAGGYKLEYKEDNDPYMPQDFTIKKTGSITQVPSREPNFTLKGKNADTGPTLDIQAYRGTVNINCDTKESFMKDTQSYTTMVAPKGELILLIGLSND
jgi:hypothetical protein